jgi:hypothetical protein
LTSEILKVEAASCKTLCVASPFFKTTSIAPCVATYGTMRTFKSVFEFVQMFEIRRVSHRRVQISAFAF